MSGEVEKCPILHVRPKFDVFTLVSKSSLQGIAGLPSTDIAFINPARL